MDDDDRGEKRRRPMNPGVPSAQFLAAAQRLLGDWLRAGEGHSYFETGTAPRLSDRIARALEEAYRRSPQGDETVIVKLPSGTRYRINNGPVEVA